MQKTMKIVFLLVLAITNQQIGARPLNTPDEVWLEIKGATAFEEEFIRKSLALRNDGILKLKRDDNFDNTKGISYEGGIRITIKDTDTTCFATRRSWSYNIDLQRLQINSIIINRECLNWYMHDNRYYAFRNAIDHEAECHAFTGLSKHTSWGLCKADLSTSQVYGNSKRHRHYVRKNLNLPGLTGEVLGENQLRSSEEETLCEIGLPEND